MNESKIVIVGVSHITFSNEYKEKIYYFKAASPIRTGAIVVCNTRYGAALGIVRNVISSVEELIKNKKLRYVLGNMELKDCKPLPNYCVITLSEEKDELPF